MPSRKSDASKPSNMNDSIISQSEDVDAPAKSSAHTDSTLKDVEIPSAEASAAEGKSSNSKPRESVSNTIAIEDLNLPKSIITRLAKGVLPPNTQIQANAILAMQKGSTVFINYLANQANEHTSQAGRKTITPADVFKALDDLEFGSWKENLEAELSKFTEIQTEKRSQYKKKSTDKASKSVEAANNSDTQTETGDASGRAAKKARMEDGADVTMASDEEEDAVLDETMQEADDDEGEGGEVDAEDMEEDDEGDEEDEEPNDEADEADADKDEALDNGEDSD